MVLSSAGNDHQVRAAHCHNRKQNPWRALIDRGANGCIAGSDMTRLESTGEYIDLSGIDDHTLRNLELVTAGGVTQTPQGDIIIIVHQTAWMPDGRTILSTGQLEHFKVKVDERSKQVTGTTPSITTLEGYVIPIATHRGLPYIKLRPIRDDERSTLPSITLTSPHPWDPSVLDAQIDDKWYRQTTPPSEYAKEIPFDVVGRLHDQPNDDDVLSDQDDRHHQSVDRAGIKALLADLIRDEIQTEFTVCNIEGHLHEVRWNKPWGDDSLDDGSDDGSTPPLMGKHHPDDVGGR
jgi:hypothetical protein